MNPVGDLVASSLFRFIFEFKCLQKSVKCLKTYLEAKGRAKKDEEKNDILAKPAVNENAIIFCSVVIMIFIDLHYVFFSFVLQTNTLTHTHT